MSVPQRIPDVSFLMYFYYTIASLVVPAQTATAAIVRDGFGVTATSGGLRDGLGVAALGVRDGA